MRRRGRPWGENRHHGRGGRTGGQGFWLAGLPVLSGRLRRGRLARLIFGLGLLAIEGRRLIEEADPPAATDRRRKAEDHTGREEPAPHASRAFHASTCRRTCAGDVPP